MNPAFAGFLQRAAGLLDGITAGSLEVRLADSASDIEGAQALRYRVFYKAVSYTHLTLPTIYSV